MTSKLRVIEKFIAFMDELEAFVSDSSVPQSPNPKLSDYEVLVQLLASDEWPEAVDPLLICDPDSESDQFDRAEAIIYDIPEGIAGLKFLDFGCGGGFVTQKASELGADAIGYDIKDDAWKSDLLTTDFDVVKSRQPFDVVLLYDVLDHCDDAVAALKQVAEVCNENTRVYVVAHPWCSRHGGHLYNKNNKAFIHLVFTDAELKGMGLEYKVTKVVSPILTYQAYFRESGFKSGKPEMVRDTPEDFFKTHEVIRKRIMRNMGFNEYPEFQLSLNFLNFTLKKN